MLLHTFFIKTILLTKKNYSIMKKIFTLVAMATVALAASAQTENAWVDASKGGTDAVPVTAGTVIASSASIEMFQAFDDSYKSVSMTGESDDANTVSIDGVEYAVNENTGLQAQTNPTPNNLGAATDGAWVGGQSAGAVFGFNVKKDGLLCVFGKLTATKQYYAWEGDVTNSVASLVAYRLVGHGVAAVEGTVPTCDYTLPAAEGSNLADADAMTASAEKWLKSSNVIAAAQIIDPNFVSGNALGVVVVPVYAEAETYYVNACGSKITSNGFVFIPKDAPTAADAAALSITFSKTAAVAGVAEAKSEAAAPVKVITANGIQIGKYNVAGQQVK